ncbi:MAG: oligosaccharide flippase family protein [Vitreoscilla sp.]|nr:oligosaccharide flippase family protein [Polaromonas sp.]
MMAGDSLRRGLLANYLGKGFCALLGLISLPVLYRQLGPEAFGLFGLFFSVQAVLGVFDFGVGAAMQRDLAALDANSRRIRPADVCATLRSIERLLWVIAITVCAVAFSLSTYLAGHWLGVQALPIEVVASTLGWITIAAALQLIGSFYMGCLNGLRLHAQTNIIQSSVWATRFVALMICIKAGVAPPASMSLAVLSVLQAWSAANLLLVVWARMNLTRALPATANTSGVVHLKRAAQFGLPLVATTTLIMLFNQVDKIAASRLITLETLGKYTIVWSVAEVMYLMYQPIYTSFLPVFAGRFAAAQDAGHSFELSQSVSLAWQMMTVAVFPVAVVIFALSGLVVFAWTGDRQLAQTSSGVLRWVIVGAGINAFLFIPFALQQAAGDMRPWAWRIALSLLLYAPLAIAAISRWGMLGAAAAWCLGSACLALWLARASIQYLGRQGLQLSDGAGMFTSSLKTLIICSMVVLLVLLFPFPAERYGAAALTLGTLAVCLLLALRSQPGVWTLFLQLVHRMQGKHSRSASS